METKNDLRVAKTRRAIKAAFNGLICTRPVNKITVTGLARAAEINKGTFYLHYADIYDLYDAVLEETVARMVAAYDPYPLFFSDPEAFVREFLFTPVAPPRPEEIALLKEENLRFSSKYPALFVNAFRQKLYEVGEIAPGRENDAKLEYFLNGMLSLLIRPELLGGPAGDPAVVGFLAGSIRQLYPQFHALKGCNSSSE